MSSNKQSVNVIINNKLNSCCEKKKKRKMKTRDFRQEPQPQIENEFPALPTPAARQGAAFIPSGVSNRNSVYIPNSAQIEPEGVQPPIPAYFEKHYTNLQRTIDDMKENLMREIDDVKMSMDTNPYMVSPPFTLYNVPQEIREQPEPMSVPENVAQEAQQLSRQLSDPGPSTSYATSTPINHTSYSYEELNKMTIEKSLREIYRRLYPVETGKPRTLPKKDLYINAILDYQNISKNGIPSRLLSGL
jgi:hypothetical protein